MSVIVLGISVLGVYWQKISDPYIQEVLSLQGNVERGYEIFQINCAGCHAIQTANSVGPSLKNISKRRSKIGTIEQVISGQTPPMPKFQPTSQEMADLLKFLQQL
ncbi:c-type cytochrome [Myxosarcina sp. GI1(2024)]